MKRAEGKSRAGTCLRRVIGLVLFAAIMMAAGTAWAEMGPKTKKAIDKVNADIAKCQAKAEKLEEWSKNFAQTTKSFIRDNNEIKEFDDDSLAHTSWARRSKTWRQVKDKLKDAYGDYHKTCAGITDELSKIDKLKNK